MNLSDTDQAPYSAPAPQTATVSDEAVQAAFEEYGGSYRSIDAMKDALTAALPHLSQIVTKPVDVAAVREQTFEEIALIATQQKEYWDNKQRDCKALEDAYSENGDTYTPLGDDEAWKAGYANGHFSEACWLLGTIRALSPAEPVDQWQDIATAPKDGSAFLAVNTGEIERWNTFQEGVVINVKSTDRPITCAFYNCDNDIPSFFDEFGEVYRADGIVSDADDLTAADNVLRLTNWMPLPAAPNQQRGE